MTLQEALKILEETFPGKPVAVCVKLTNYLPQSKVSLYCEGKKWTGEHSALTTPWQTSKATMFQRCLTWRCLNGTRQYKGILL